MLTLNKFSAFWASVLLLGFTATFLLIPRSADVLLARYNQNYPYYNNYYPNNNNGNYYNYNSQPSGSIYQQAPVTYLNVNPNPVYPSYPNYPVYGTAPTSGSGNNLSGNFSLTSNNDYRVGQTPTYTISAPSNWDGQIINWTSSHNGISSQTTFSLNSSGQWTASGNTWGYGDVGSWQKTANINGVSQTLSFSVQNCGGTPVVNNPYPSNNDGFGNTIGGSTVSSGGGLIGGSVGGYGLQTIGGSVYGSGYQTIGGSTAFN